MSLGLVREVDSSDSADREMKPVSMTGASELFKKKFNPEPEKETVKARKEPDNEDEDEPEEDGESDGEQDGEAEGLQADSDDETDDEDGEEDSGEEAALKKSELDAGYLRQADYTRKTQELSAQRETAEKKIQEFDAAIKEASSLVNALELEFNQDYQNINWKELRELDPAEFAAKYTEFQQRSFKIGQYKQAHKDQEQKLLKDRDLKNQQILAQEHQALLSKIPSWTKAEVSKAESSKVTQYMLTSGYSENEIGKITDHRVIVAHRKAMLYDKLQGKNEIVSKKVKSVPKFQKPGARKAVVSKNKTAIDSAMERLKKTGKVNDAASLFSARFSKR